MNKTKIFNNKGMTLVEVIISITMLALASMILIIAFSVSLNTLKQATQKTRAFNSAAAEIEQNKAGAFAPDISSQDSSIIINFSNSMVTSAIPGIIYKSATSDGTYKSFTPD